MKTDDAETTVSPVSPLTPSRGTGRESTSLRPSGWFCRGCQRGIEKHARWCSDECKVQLRRLSNQNRGLRYANYELRAFILGRDRFSCVYCGTDVTNETANIDHVKPWPYGLTTPRNLVTSCRECNKRKSNFVELHARRRRGKQRISRLSQGAIRVALKRHIALR